MEILSKITLKKCATFPEFKALVAADTAEPGKVTWLMKVYGIAAKIKPDSSDLGPYVRFVGQFRSVDMVTGRICSAGQMILPKIAQDLLAGAVESSNSVQFGFQLGVRYDETAAVKYVYVCESLLAPAQNDPLTMLESSIKTGAPVPVLEAPKASEPAESELHPVSAGGDGAERAIKAHRNGKRAA